MVDHLDTKNLVPFSKRRRNSFQLPGARKSPDEEMLEQVDPNLRPEDEGVIRRYLQYADTLLGSSETGELTLVPGGGPAKELAANPEPDLESRVEGFKPDLLDHVRAEADKHRRERAEESEAEQAAEAHEQDSDKAA